MAETDHAVANRPVRSLCHRYFFRPLRVRERDDLRGTFAPFSRASLRPIAIACFRLLTRRPERPLFSVPRFRRRIADSTLFDAFLPYLAIETSAFCLHMLSRWRASIQKLV